MGVQPDERDRVTVKLDDYHKISARTKVQLMKDRKERKDGDLKQKAKAAATKGAGPSGLGRASQMGGKSPRVKDGSKGIIGQFLSTKKAEFNEEEHKVQPSLVDDKKQSAVPKYVDLSAIRKGIGYHGLNKNQREEEKQTIEREALLQDREQTLI